YTGAKDGAGVPITESFHGVSVTAVAFQDFVSVAVGGAAAGSAAVAGSATVESLNETSKAHVDAGAQINVTATGAHAHQAANIHATNTTRVISGAGGFAGGTPGGGPGSDGGGCSKGTRASRPQA